MKIYNGEHLGKNMLTATTELDRDASIPSPSLTIEELTEVDSTTPFKKAENFAGFDELTTFAQKGDVSELFNEVTTFTRKGDLGNRSGEMTIFPKHEDFIDLSDKIFENLATGRDTSNLNFSQGNFGNRFADEDKFESLVAIIVRNRATYKTHPIASTHREVPSLFQSAAFADKWDRDLIDFERFTTK